MLLDPTPASVPLLLLIALAIDAVVGDPRWLPHPVVAFGRLAARVERAANRGAATTRLTIGAATTIALIVIAAATGWAFDRAAAIPSPATPVFIALQVAVTAMLLAQRSLYDHVRAVAAPLAAGDLTAARAAIAHVVGRDPQALDAPAVARAAIETTAENFADGVVAPAFWYLLFGLPGLCAYKAINTLDSMIGHRTHRFEAFGKVAARLDDAANAVPARLAAVLIALAAALTKGANAGPPWRVMARDARKHPSPNAGWPEGAMAGALGAALLGPRSYGGAAADHPWLGAEFQSAATATHVDRALAVYVRACGLNALAVAVVALTALS